MGVRTPDQGIGVDGVLYKALTKDNDGTTLDANADYSSTAGYFYVQPAATEEWAINRVMISVLQRLYSVGLATLVPP